jgi:hypothetical protein
VEKLTGLCLGEIYIPIPIGSMLFIVYLVQYYTTGNAYSINESYATNQQDASPLFWCSSGLGRRSLSTVVVTQSHSAAMTSELATWNRTNMTSRGMRMERPSSLQSRCYRKGATVGIARVCRVDIENLASKTFLV